MLTSYSVWRPLIPVIEDAPLALCDRQSVRNTDLLECDKIHADHVGEGLYLKYRATHRWYWLPQQRSDEVLSFLTWDSEWDPDTPGKSSRETCSRVPLVALFGNPADMTAKLAGPPHAAFDNPLAPAASPPRESIEVRLMVISE